jgi:hypothetical protein
MLLQRIASKMDELRVRTQQLPHKQIHSLCLQQEKMVLLETRRSWIISLSPIGSTPTQKLRVCAPPRPA